MIPLSTHVVVKSNDPLLQCNECLLAPLHTILSVLKGPQAIKRFRVIREDQNIRLIHLNSLPVQLTALLVLQIAVSALLVIPCTFLSICLNQFLIRQAKYKGILTSFKRIYYKQRILTNSTHQKRTDVVLSEYFKQYIRIIAFLDYESLKVFSIVNRTSFYMCYSPVFANKLASKLSSDLDTLHKEHAKNLIPKIIDRQPIHVRHHQADFRRIFKWLLKEDVKSVMLKRMIKIYDPKAFEQLRVAAEKALQFFNIVIRVTSFLKEDDIANLFRLNKTSYFIANSETMQKKMEDIQWSHFRSVHEKLIKTVMPKNVKKAGKLQNIESDVLIHIFSYFINADVAFLSITCKNWFHVIHKDISWEDIGKKSFPHRKDKLAFSLLKWAPLRTFEEMQKLPSEYEALDRRSIQAFGGMEEINSFPIINNEQPFQGFPFHILKDQFGIHPCIRFSANFRVTSRGSVRGLFKTHHYVAVNSPEKFSERSMLNGGPLNIPQTAIDQAQRVWNAIEENVYPSILKFNDEGIGVPNQRITFSDKWTAFRLD